MSSPLFGMLFGDQTGGMSPRARNLSRIDSSKYNKDFVNNMAGLNAATDYMAKYLIVMQDGIDEANKNIIQKIQDFIADLIIIFTGGADTGFEFGDLEYFISALGALFGFQGASGPVNLLNAALHFLENFLEPLGAFGDAINSFISGALSTLASLLNMVPVVGSTLAEIINNIANGINDTDATANAAIEAADAAAYRVNFTPIYNFETADIRAEYPPNGGANGFSYENTPGIGSSGTWYMKLQPTAGYTAYANTLITPEKGIDVVVGENLYVEWKQRRFGSPNFRVACLIYFYDDTGTYLVRSNEAGIVPIGVEPDEWNTYASQVVVPNNAVKADVRIVLFEEAGITPTAASGWYIDDIVAGRMMPISVIEGLSAELAAAVAIAESADMAVQGLEDVASDHEDRITYLESGAQVAEIAVNGTWTKPSSMSYHKPTLIGGAGGGCGGCSAAAAPRGYGGGPGGWAEQVFTNASLPATVGVTIGTGGNGGARRSGNTPYYGSDGTATTFGSYLTAGGGEGGDNNSPPNAGTGTRNDFQPFGGRGAGVTGNGDDGSNGYLVSGGNGGTGNGGAGQPGGSPPPGQRGIGSGGGGGAGNSGGGGECAGGDGGFPGGGGGAGGGAMNWIGFEQGGKGGKGGNGKAWVLSSPGFIT